MATPSPVNFFMILIAGLLTVAGCSVGEFGGSASKLSSGGKRSNQLTLTGSSTIAPLIQEIAIRFEKANPGVRVDVQTGGSSRGIRDARKGAADIGMSSRNLTPNESAALDSTVIAWDGVAFVTHRDNRVTEISREHLRQIYLGKIKNWSAIGGSDQRVIVSNRAAGRSELELVCEFLKIESGDIEADIIDGETQQSLKSVINNPKAITYTSIGAAQDAASRGQPLRLLPLGGVAASSNTVGAGKYPLARPLILAVSKNSQHAAKDKLISTFLKFATSKSVTDAVLDLGFVPEQGALMVANAK